MTESSYRRLHINVVTQFLAGNFYCKFGIYNAKSMFCQNIVPLGQLEAEILIDLCSIKRSYFPDPIKRSYVTEWSVLCTYTTTIFVWVYYTKKYISKHLASVHHNNFTLKGLFLRFYGSDPGDTTFWNSTNSFESEPLKICFLALLKSCTFWATTFLYVGDDMWHAHSTHKPFLTASRSMLYDLEMLALFLK